MKGYDIRCPVCSDYAINMNRRSSKGFKGATYTTEYYDHGDRECVLQKTFYPNYFGKGPKTVTSKTTRNPWYTPKTKETISFVKTPSGTTKLSKNVPRDIFLRLLKEKAVKPPKEGTKEWDFDPEKARPILEKQYEIV